MMCIHDARKVANSAKELVWNGKSFDEKCSRATGIWLVAEDTTPTGRSAYLRSYSGTAILVDFDKDVVLAGPVPIATHPGQKRTAAKGTPDVDKDGSPDVAWALPNVEYPMVGKLNSSSRFNPATKYQAVQRDTESSGKAYGPIYPATYIQYHAGNTSSPSSVGCWTSPPKEYKQMSDAILKYAPGGFSMVFRRV